TLFWVLILILCGCSYTNTNISNSNINNNLNKTENYNFSDSEAFGNALIRVDDYNISSEKYVYMYEPTAEYTIENNYIKGNDIYPSKRGQNGYGFPYTAYNLINDNTIQFKRSDNGGNYTFTIKEIVKQNNIAVFHIDVNLSSIGNNQTKELIFIPSSNIDWDKDVELISNEYGNKKYKVYLK
ncbi:MAG: hypothetical protein K1V95_08605, partial [Eubacterium sp.]